MGRPRRSHPKSRLGCVQCKLRRVKCDETKPSCKNCERRGCGCSYSSPQRTAEALDNGFTKRDVGASLFSPSGPSDVFTNRGPGARQEMQLVHQWTLSTHSSLGKDEADYEKMRTECTKMAFDHSFLLNSIFSLTALHLAFLEPHSALEYGDLAVAYQEPALAEFRNVLFKPTAEQCPALFWSSVMIGITTFALPRIHPKSAKSDPITTLINLSRLLSGCGAVIELSKQLMGEDGWAAFFPENPRPKPSQLSPSTEQALQRLAALAEMDDSSAPASPSPRSQPEEEGVYTKSVRLLREHFEIAVTKEQQQILAWPVVVGTMFTARLEQERPLARLIAMCYGVLLGYLEQRWWAKGSGRQLTDLLAGWVRSQQPQWSDLADWATESISASCYEGVQYEVSESLDKEGRQKQL